jgi:hypothetical protein
MTDEAYEIKCDECDGMFVDGQIFNLIGWIKPSPVLTLDDEVKYNFDAGNLCKVCYSYRISQLQQKSTKL